MKAGQKTPAVRKLRCAVYTRKSTEEGLEQAFNSLDAQREACEACVASQRAEGWVLVADRYRGLGLRLRTDGLASLVRDLTRPDTTLRSAA